MIGCDGLMKKVLVVGATGLIGKETIKKFVEQNNVEVVGVSRRPVEVKGMTHLQVDLTDERQCNELFSQLTDVTHVVYAALYEKPKLTAGWTDEEQIEMNKRMIKNVLEPLEKASRKTLKHITLLQGTKAYGGHVREFKIPAKEGISDARDLPNFYWEQQHYIEELQVGKGWNWTILRPQIVVGESIGSPMNVISAIGVYASLLKEEGLPLYYPGTVSSIIEFTDVSLLAEAIVWAGESEAAKNEIFNITNGDVSGFKHLWDAIAESFGMEPGEHKPMYLHQELSKKEKEWDMIRKKYALNSPKLMDFVGQSFQFVDRYMHELKYPLIVSAIKIRKAGFDRFVDSEEMIRKWFKTYKQNKLLPPAD